MGKEVHTFPKIIILKVNVIAQLECEPTYFEVAVKHVSHYTMGTPSRTSNIQKQM